MLPNGSSQVSSSLPDSTSATSSSLARDIYEQAKSLIEGRARDHHTRHKSRAKHQRHAVKHVRGLQSDRVSQKSRKQNAGYKSKTVARDVGNAARPSGSLHKIGPEGTPKEGIAEGLRQEAADIVAEDVERLRQEDVEGGILR